MPKDATPDPHNNWRSYYIKTFQQYVLSRRFSIAYN